MVHRLNCVHKLNVYTVCIVICTHFNGMFTVAGFALFCDVHQVIFSLSLSLAESHPSSPPISSYSLYLSSQVIDHEISKHIGWQSARQRASSRSVQVARRPSAPITAKATSDQRTAAVATAGDNTVRCPHPSWGWGELTQPTCTMSCHVPESWVTCQDYSWH